MRAAIYYTPAAGDPLARAAADWLGRSAFDGEATRAPDEALDAWTASPRRYGFHATMRAPFRLAEGTDLLDVDARLASLCAALAPVRIARLELARLGRFLALVPGETPAGLAALERDVVEAFDPLRAPLTAEEVARRKPERLSKPQRRNIERWGYPYVLGEFRLHMTVTGSLEGDALACAETRARSHFAPFLGAPLAIDRLAVFVEPEPGAPFRVHSLHPFGTTEEKIH